MKFELKVLCADHVAQFKKDMQEAFQQGAEDGLGEAGGEILPESHIDLSLGGEGCGCL